MVYASIFLAAFLTGPVQVGTGDSTLVGSQVTGAFAVEATAAVGSIPTDVFHTVRDRGWRIELVPSIDSALPELAVQRPRGWPSGWTWANVDAVHLPAEKRLIFAQWRRSLAGGWVPSSRVGGVVRHELGHAWDVAWSTTPYSECEPFFSCYARDLARMGLEERRPLAYFVQDSSAGRQEVFAELFAVRFGGGSSPEHEGALRQAFPSCAALIDKLFAEEDPDVSRRETLAARPPQEGEREDSE